MYDYSNFVANVRKRIADGQERDEAVKAAVDDAINNKLLDGLFEEQKWEIIGLMLAEFDQEIYEKTVREEGAQQKAIESALKMLADGMTPELVAKYVDLPVNEIKVLQVQPQPAEV